MAEDDLRSPEVSARSLRWGDEWFRWGAKRPLARRPSVHVMQAAQDRTRSAAVCRDVSTLHPHLVASRSNDYGWKFGPVEPIFRAAVSCSGELVDLTPA